MVIVPVSGEITRPLIKKYQFSIVFMEVVKILINIAILNTFFNQILLMKIKFNLSKDLLYKLYRQLNNLRNICNITYIQYSIGK